MELYMCGFNGHHQLVQDSNDNVSQFKKVCRSPHIDVRCAFWSATVVEHDGVLVHNGFRSQDTNTVVIDGPPCRNIKIIFGNTGGVLGALTTDGSLYSFCDGSDSHSGPRLNKHCFDSESFISKQNLTIAHLAIADNDEVSVITSSHHKVPAGLDVTGVNDASHSIFSAPTANLEVHKFPSIDKFLASEAPTSTSPLSSSIVSLHASATSFAALTSSQEVLTFGSALHPQMLGRTPTQSNPAHFPFPIPFLGGIPIRKVAISGWIGAAVSEDHDLYVWGGSAGEAQRISALPKLSDGEEVKLVDINGGVDVVDVGVGLGHIVALTGDGQVWAVGEAEYGQLGTGSNVFEKDWVRVRGEWEGKGKVTTIGCGVWCSWITVDAN